MSISTTTTPHNTEESANYKKLIDLATQRTLSNSYYDDERYNSCKTPDFDTGYQFLQDLAKDPKELERVLSETHPKTISGETFTFSGAEAAKIIIHGDFGEQLSETSSAIENIKTIRIIAQAVQNPEIWQKRMETGENRDTNKNYSIKYLQEKSLAEAVGDRLESVGYPELAAYYSRVEDDGAFEAALEASKILRKFPEFISGFRTPDQEEVDNFVKEHLQEGKYHPVDQTKSLLRKMGRELKKGNFSVTKEIPKDLQWTIPSVIKRFVFTGTTSIKEVDALLNSDVAVKKALQQIPKEDISL